MVEYATIERLYILNGGLARVEDAAIYSPGVHVSQPMTLSCNVYLLKHSEGWLIWDTGTPDEVIDTPGGKIIAHGIRGIVTRTIRSQLAGIGVTPEEIGTILISHAHYDHIGNSRLFPNAHWIAQSAERDAMFGDDPDQFGFLPELYDTLRNNPTTVVDGDHDVFGDGSVSAPARNRPGGAQRRLYPQC
jgi:N-acyl homoserine lactone hydrolase